MVIRGREPTAKGTITVRDGMLARMIDLLGKVKSLAHTLTVVSRWGEHA
jgi:hypothetical protein